MRVRRLLLFILVAVNLTLVCQGHTAGSGHTGVHLALLGEPHLEDEAGDATGKASSVSHEPGHAAIENARAEGTGPIPIEAAGRKSDLAALGAGHFSSLDTLAVALLSTLAGATRTLSLRLTMPLTWTSRFRRPPEPPPPQTHI
jgi:hypothetical protein